MMKSFFHRIGRLMILAGFMPCLIVHAAHAASPVDVTTLGVIPDDGLSDTSAITAALAANDSIYFPPGEYSIASTIFVPSAFALHGAGMDLTTFTLLADTVAFRVDGSSDVYMQGFSINRPFDNSRDEAIFVYNNAQRVRLHNLRVANQRSRAPALSFLSSTDVEVWHCETYDFMRQIFEDGEDQVYGSGITFNSCVNVVCEYNTVVETRDLSMPTNPYFNYFQSGSIQVSACTNARVQHNYVETAGQAIDMSGTQTGLVRRNVITNCHSVGIKLVNGNTGVDVIDNHITNAGLIGIWLAPGSTNLPIVDCLVQNNVIIGTGKGIGQDWWDGFFTNSVPAGIHLDNADSEAGRSNNDTIIGNRFYDNDQMLHDVIIRPSDLDAYNITLSDNISLSDPPPPASEPPAPPPLAMPLSLNGGVEGAGEPITRATDQQAVTRALIQQDAAPASGRWSFMLNLGSVREVVSLGLYGQADYRADEAAPGGLVRIEAAATAAGPFEFIGELDLGGDRATNPFTGGKGKRIQVDPTITRLLRVSGGPWQDSFDNNVVLSEVLINPLIVLHDYSPVHNPNVPLPNPAGHPQETVWDIGGGFENDRVGLDMFDGKLGTRTNPQRRLRMTLDVSSYGTSDATVDSFVLYPFDNDLNLLPRTGFIRTSSTNDPDNMDLQLTSFDELVDQGTVTINLPAPATRRYFEIEFLSNQTGSTGEADQRIGEIIFTGLIVPVELSQFELK